MASMTDIKEVHTPSQATTRHYARTFYFASFMLPKAKRQAAYEVYAFCRYADNIFDDPADDADRRLQKLAAVKGDLAKIYAGEAASDSKFSALGTVIQRYNIPREPFDALLDGVVMDLEVKRYATWEELEVYCYRVASVVGLIMSSVLGASDPRAGEHAVALGKAMQLTNILRDIKEDLEIGRIYLPKEDLTRFGCSEELLLAKRVTPEFSELMKFEIARARQLYREGENGLVYLPDDGARFCAKVMSFLYARILNVIEKNGYDVFTRRAAVPFVAKLFYVVRLLLFK